MNSNIQYKDKKSNTIFYRKKVLFIVFLCLMNFASFAQSKSINYENIFGTAFTYVGIPNEDSLYIFGLKEKQWQQVYSFKIPDNTVALDGNERRVFFLTDKEMIVQHYYNCGSLCGKDTLRLSDIKGEIISKHWLRNISSTESDFAVFQFSALQYYYQNGDGWNAKLFSNPFEKTEKKNPKFYLDMPYEKIMSYVDDMYLITEQNQHLNFWIFDVKNILEKAPQLKNELTPIENLDVQLPKDVISVFVYDSKQLGWIYKDKIEFHSFNKQKQMWKKSSIPDLKFNDVLRKW